MRSVEGAHQAVLAAAKELLHRGLVEGTSGNISARMADGNIVCTPSSVDYQAMTLEDLVVVSAAGEVVAKAAERSPTSELLLHLACYRAYDDIGAVIHAHPVWATMWACAHEPVPACVDEFTMYIGGDVRCAEYAMSGSADVGAHAVEALRDRGAALLANHGMVAVAQNPAKALHIVALVERTAQIAWGARALGGLVPIPAKVNEDFAGVYQLMRSI
ncbi:MAG TPA: L-fuculose-phosphate aldolase [Acidimicrobiales bacterium]|nr:L-fuculose-phosphate aldolase [Acidimicrobiales bacterium]